MKKFIVIFFALLIMSTAFSYSADTHHVLSKAISTGFTFTFLLLLYFLPSINAEYKKHPSYQSISTLNLLLGWTIIGWVGALIWSQSKRA